MKRQVFVVWFLIFLAWSFYRANFFLPEAIDEFLVKPLIFVLPIVYVVVIREKKKLSELGLTPKPKDFILDLFIGTVIGIIFALEGLVANYLKNGQYSFGPILAVKAGGGVAFFLLINLITSVWEEILGRGYIYNRLYKATKNQFWAAFTGSYMFLLLHIPIIFTRLHLRGSSLLIYPVSVFLLSIANSYIFSLRGSLTLPILIHTFWNMTVALFL